MRRSRPMFSALLAAILAMPAIAEDLIYRMHDRQDPLDLQKEYDGKPASHFMAACHAAMGYGEKAAAKNPNPSEWERRYGEARRIFEEMLRVRLKMDRGLATMPDDVRSAGRTEIQRLVAFDKDPLGGSDLRLTVLALTCQDNFITKDRHIFPSGLDEQQRMMKRE